MKRSSLLVLVVPAAWAFACSSSSSGSGVGSSGGGGDDAGADAPTGAGTQCTAAFNANILPISKVSTATVSTVGASGGATELYVDASAGGINLASKNPRVYVNLETGTRVDIDDVTAFKSSTDWDLALRRDLVWTNSGDAGIGIGGAIQIAKTFANVTAADADAATLAPERFFDDQCNALKGPNDETLTTFSDWYNYNQATHDVTPKDVTYVVRGGTGKRYKVALLSYIGLPDGGMGSTTSTGYFLLKVAPL